MKFCCEFFTQTSENFLAYLKHYAPCFNLFADEAQQCLPTVRRNKAKNTFRLVLEFQMTYISRTKTLIRPEKTALQMATVICLWFLGVLTCPGCNCDWSVTIGLSDTNHGLPQ